MPKDERSELVELIRGRRNQDFDGECHLTIPEADRIIASLNTQAGVVEALAEAVTCLTWIASLGYGGAPDIAMRKAARESLERISALSLGVGE